jgi:flagellar hook-basal body complex protein FliE
MSIEAISIIGSLDSAKAVESAQTTASYGFGDLMISGINDVSQSLKSTDVALLNMALDKPVSAHEVMLTMEKAKMDLRLVIEVRNKLLEGYQELMRMQV